MKKTPPHLTIGDTIGITATARKVLPEEINFAVKRAEEAGFKVLLSDGLFEEKNQFAGTDEQRSSNFNQMLANPQVKAIWCARGGYGSVKILELIDWNLLKKQPKWICGFSDVTAIHSHLSATLRVASIHSPMPFAFDRQSPDSQNHFMRVLLGEEIELQAPAHALNRPGESQGALVGGNLSVLYSLLGSQSQLNTKNAILFLEDLDEYLYHIDRMMMALKRSGMLSQLKGLIVGGFTDIHDNASPYGMTAEEIIRDTVKDYNYPVCFGFPSGHITGNMAWLHGVDCHLHVEAGSVVLHQNQSQ